jgi:hypothetical protein
MPIHVGAVALTLPLYANGCLFNAYAKLKVPCFMSLATTVLLVSAGALMMKGFGLGLVGLAAADAAMTVTYLVFFSSYYVRRITGFGLGEHLFDAYVRPVFFSAAFCVAVSSAARALFLAGHFSSAAAVVALGAVGYALGAYGLVLNREEKELVRRNVSFLRTRFSACRVRPEIR